MEIKGYKFNLKNKSNMRDGFDRKIKFFVYVLPMVDQGQKLWNIYISIKGYGLIAVINEDTNYCVQEITYDEVKGD